MDSWGLDRDALDGHLPGSPDVHRVHAQSEHGGDGLRPDARAEGSGRALAIPGRPWVPAIFILAVLGMTRLSVARAPSLSLAGVAVLGFIQA